MEEDNFDPELIAQRAAPLRVSALSQTQERKLVDYLEDKFLEVTRAYAKRLVLSRRVCA